MTGNKEELEMLTMSDKVMNLLLTSYLPSKIDRREFYYFAGCGLIQLRAAGLVAGLTNFYENIVKM